MRLSESQIDRAYRLFYGENKSLGEIHKELGCGLYDLTPWLTAPFIRIAHDSAACHKERADDLMAQNEKLREELRVANRRLRKRAAKAEAAEKAA